jgi:ABC-2 type transport system permease protein
MTAAAAELAKVSAFVRRDFRVAVSYRTAAVGELLALAAQALVLSFIGKLVDPARLPEFGGSRATYMEFVVIGIAVSLMVMALVAQVANAIRNEQLIGTLESLLSTPTRVGTIQIGSAALTVITIPLRIALFIGVLALVFGLHFQLDGILPGLLLVIAFLPFLWGLGLIAGGIILTVRRGAGALAILITAMGVSAGAVFPLALLPHWLAQVAAENPLAITINGLREELIGGGAWAPIGADLLRLAPLSLLALGAGILAFRLSLARERRRGTLGLY